MIYLLFCRFRLYCHIASNMIIILNHCCQLSIRNEYFSSGLCSLNKSSRILHSRILFGLVGFYLSIIHSTCHDFLISLDDESSSSLFYPLLSLLSLRKMVGLVTLLLPPYIPLTKLIEEYIN
jgi:hypothetical protein